MTPTDTTAIGNATVGAASTIATVVTKPMGPSTKPNDRHATTRKATLAGGTCPGKNTTANERNGNVEEVAVVAPAARLTIAATARKRIERGVIAIEMREGKVR